MAYKPNRIRADAPGTDMTASGSLKEAIANLSSNAATSIGTIQRLQSSDPSGLSSAAVELLVSAEEKSPGLQYLAGYAGGGQFVGRPAHESARSIATGGRRGNQ
jgi:hypothetical protein